MKYENKYEDKRDQGPFDTKLTRQETWVVLRALDLYSMTLSGVSGARIPGQAGLQDRGVCHIVADRLLRILPENREELKVKEEIMPGGTK